MTILGRGRAPAREHVMKLAKQFDIKPKSATGIIDEVSAAVAKWRRFADAAGCT
jgi:hypothetical protein